MGAGLRILAGVSLSLTMGGPGRTASAQSLDGLWIDSQANDFQIRQTGEKLRMSSPGWKFRTPSGSRELNIDLAGAVKNGTLTLGDTELTLNGRVVEGRIRATISGRKLEAPIDFILSRHAENSAAANGTASRISIQATRASGRVGTWIPLSVVFVDRNSQVVAPSRDTFVELTADGGHPLPGIVKLSSKYAAAPAGLMLDQKGAITLRASSPGLGSAEIQEFGCPDGKPTRIQIGSEPAQARADGIDTVRVTVFFLDDTRNLATSAAPKYIAWKREGVGRLSTAPDRLGRSQDAVISPGECVVRNELRSKQAGKAVLTAAALGSSDSGTVYFIAPLGWGLLLAAGFGAGAGAFVSAMRNYGSATRWKAKRWAVWLACGVIGGFALFFAYYYGLLKQAPQFPSGYGFAFFVGLVGGFLGDASLARIGDLLLPKRGS